MTTELSFLVCTNANTTCMYKYLCIYLALETARPIKLYSVGNVRAVYTHVIHISSYKDFAAYTTKSNLSSPHRVNFMVDVGKTCLTRNLVLLYGAFHLSICLTHSFDSLQPLSCFHDCKYKISIFSGTAPAWNYYVLIIRYCNSFRRICIVPFIFCTLHSYKKLQLRISLQYSVYCLLHGVVPRTRLPPFTSTYISFICVYDSVERARWKGKPRNTNIFS